MCLVNMLTGQRSPAGSSGAGKGGGASTTSVSAGGGVAFALVRIRPTVDRSMPCRRAISAFLTPSVASATICESRRARASASLPQRSSLPWRPRRVCTSLSPASLGRSSGLSAHSVMTAWTMASAVSVGISVARMSRPFPRSWTTAFWRTSSAMRHARSAVTNASQSKLYSQHSRRIFLTASWRRTAVETTETVVSGKSGNWRSVAWAPGSGDVGPDRRSATSSRGTAATSGGSVGVSTRVSTAIWPTVPFNLVLRRG